MRPPPYVTKPALHKAGFLKAIRGVETKLLNVS
jgi:hypothetical protein